MVCSSGKCYVSSCTPSGSGSGLIAKATIDKQQDPLCPHFTMLTPSVNYMCGKLCSTGSVLHNAPHPLPPPRPTGLPAPIRTTPTTNLRYLYQRLKWIVASALRADLIPLYLGITLTFCWCCCAMYNLLGVNAGPKHCVSLTGCHNTGADQVFLIPGTHLPRTLMLM